MKTAIYSRTVASPAARSVLLSCLVSFCLGCGHPSESQQRSISEPARTSGIYHWKTTFGLTPYDSTFLRHHHISQVYMRLFDVDYTTGSDGSNKSVPIATTRFKSTVPRDIEVIPVVYITQAAIKHDSHFAELLYRRILAMSKRNGFSPLREIQLDCDWTRHTRKPFFRLCSQVAKLAHADSIRLSATIRLHQLRDAVPPVDRGVLMLYNTGSFYNPRTANSILNDADVAPYITSRINYDLPLTLAFPTYGWGILMRNHQFVSILHHRDYSNTSYYSSIGDHQYEVVKDHFLENKEIRQGDIIRLETSQFDEIMKVKQQVESHLVHGSQGILLYHLDSLGLSDFTPTQINEILK